MTPETRRRRISSTACAGSGCTISLGCIGERTTRHRREAAPKGLGWKLLQTDLPLGFRPRRPPFRSSTSIHEMIDSGTRPGDSPALAISAAAARCCGRAPTPLAACHCMYSRNSLSRCSAVNSRWPQGAGMSRSHRLRPSDRTASGPPSAASLCNAPTVHRNRRCQIDIAPLRMPRRLRTSPSW